MTDQVVILFALTPALLPKERVEVSEALGCTERAADGSACGSFDIAATGPADTGALPLANFPDLSTFFRIFGKFFV